MNFYTSDLHFGHENILVSCGRLYETLDEMDADLIKRWNAKVGDNDDVYICGDLSYRSAKHIGYLWLMELLT